MGILLLFSSSFTLTHMLYTGTGIADLEGFNFAIFLFWWNFSLKSDPEIYSSIKELDKVLEGFDETPVPTPRKSKLIKKYDF